MYAWTLAVRGSFVLAACGRVGFDPQPLADATAVIVDDPACTPQPGQSARVLHLVGVTAGDHLATGSNRHTATYCYSGLYHGGAGSLTASMVHDGGTGTVTESTVDIATGNGFGTVTLHGPGCTPCFVQIEADGLIDDGPVTNYSD